MTCRWHWLDIKCPSKSRYHSSPQLDRGGKISTKGSLIKIKTGRNHSQVTITGKTNLTRGNYFVTNKRIKNKTKLKALTLLLLRLYFAPHFFASSHHWHKGTGNGAEVIHHTLSLLFLSPQGFFTLLHCSGMDSLHRKQSYMNFSNVSSSHGLQFFRSCSSLGSLPYGAIPQEEAAPAWVLHGVTSPVSKPAPVWAPFSRVLSPQVPLGTSSSMGFLWGHTLPQAPTNSSVGSSTGCRGISVPVPGAPPSDECILSAPI